MQKLKVGDKAKVRNIPIEVFRVGLKPANLQELKEQEPLIVSSIHENRICFKGNGFYWLIEWFEPYNKWKQLELGFEENEIQNR